MSNMNFLTPHIISTQFIEPGQTLTLKDQARLLGISRSSLYYQPIPVYPQTVDLMHRIDKIHTDSPSFGARVISHMLRDETGLIIGRKRTRSLMEEMGIEAIYPKPNLSRNDRPHPIYPYLLKGLVINRPNQVWGTDITYIKLRGGFCYLVAFLDWYSRFVVSWKLATTLHTDFVLEAAREALSIGIPDIINSDQGVQFTDIDYINLWDQEKTRISMDHKGRCFDNIFTERFWRTLKYDEVYLKDYQTVWEAEQGIRAYIHKYNHVRPHSSLGYKTPANFYYTN